MKGFNLASGGASTSSAAATTTQNTSPASTAPPLATGVVTASAAPKGFRVSFGASFMRHRTTEAEVNPDKPPKLPPAVACFNSATPPVLEAGGASEAIHTAPPRYEEVGGGAGTSSGSTPRSRETTPIQCLNPLTLSPNSGPTMADESEPEKSVANANRRHLFQMGYQVDMDQDLEAHRPTTEVAPLLMPNITANSSAEENFSTTSEQKSSFPGLKATKKSSSGWL